MSIRGPPKRLWGMREDPFAHHMFIECLLDKNVEEKANGFFCIKKCYLTPPLSQSTS